MRIHLLAIGTRMPAWVCAGYSQYAARMPQECQLRLVEIAAAKRARKAAVASILREERDRLLAAIPRGTRILALDVAGRHWSTEQLAEQLTGWLQDGRDLTLMVGGPDGLDPACLERAEFRWSLSRLTLPHPLVRILVAEQLYRAWSLLNRHPYHRA